jgi:repressor LexA
MDKLTRQQKKALSVIIEQTESRGYAPTLRELCQHMGYRAIGSAQDMIAILRRKGYLEIPDKQTARGHILTPAAKKFFQSELSESTIDKIADFLQIPKLGRVQAGHPAEAIESNSGHLNIDRSLLPNPTPKQDQLFALQSQGLSMINAGILDGDWLVVQSKNTVNKGQIVVARTESDVTVKRLMKDTKRGWYLKPENPEFENIYADKQEFEIIGHVIALQRQIN